MHGASKAGSQQAQREAERGLCVLAIGFSHQARVIGKGPRER
jgi:hypothetical protein